MFSWKTIENTTNSNDCVTTKMCQNELNEYDFRVDVFPTKFVDPGMIHVWIRSWPDYGRSR